MGKQICLKCKYEWVSKVESPKECPHCKTRLDRILKNSDKVDEVTW